MKQSFLKNILLAAALAALPLGVSAEETATPAGAAVAGQDKSEAIRELLLPQAPVAEKDFADAVKKARELGASDQQILEAEVFRAAVQDLGGDLPALAVRLEKAAPAWDKETAFGIRDKTLAQGLVHVLRAKHAISQKDEKTFRQESALTIWAEPQLSGFVLNIYRLDQQEKALQDPSFAALDKAIATDDEAAILKAFETAFWSTPFISQEAAVEKLADYRAAKKFANLTVPLDVKFEQAEGSAVSLADLLKGKKAALLDFHASWCGPCMQLLPKLPGEAEKLGPQGVVVIAFNTEDVADAKKIRDRFKFTLPVLVEKDSVYSDPLGVDSIPRYVLIGADGKVLFNGHPMEHAKLAAALEKIGVKADKE